MMIVLRLTLKVLMITSRWITFAFARRLVAIRSWNSHLTLLLRQRHQRAIIRTKEAFMIWVFSPPLLLWSRTFWLLRFENKTRWCHITCGIVSLLSRQVNAAMCMILMTNGKKIFWNNIFIWRSNSVLFLFSLLMFFMSRSNSFFFLFPSYNVFI